MDVLIAENQAPLVSVCMTAYNQAAYIIDAIEGVLMQQTNFIFELLIGEDCGNKDDTLSICRAYEAKYPDIIRVINDGKNHGMVANEQRLMDASKGKYIAFCEADDYWIDALKLQKQVEVLEQNTQYSACACQSRVIYGTNKSYFTFLSNIDEDKSICFLEVLNANYGFQTASFIFRSENIKNITALPTNINGWDRLIFIINAFRADIFWLEEPMSVYRKNDSGISTSVRYEQMKLDLEMISWFKLNFNDFPFKALKSHILYAMILNSNEIGLFELYRCYFQAKICIKRSELDMTSLSRRLDDCVIFRSPKLIRRILRKFIGT